MCIERGEGNETAFLRPVEFHYTSNARVDSSVPNSTLAINIQAYIDN